MIFNHTIGNTNRLWHPHYQVHCQFLKSHRPKHLVVRVKLGVSMHFLENSRKNGLKFNLLICCILPNFGTDSFWDMVCVFPIFCLVCSMVLVLSDWPLAAKGCHSCQIPLSICYHLLTCYSQLMHDMRYKTVINNLSMHRSAITSSHRVQQEIEQMYAPFGKQ